jgi:hypothetical protein
VAAESGRSDGGQEQQQSQQAGMPQRPAINIPPMQHFDAQGGVTAGGMSNAFHALYQLGIVIVNMLLWLSAMLPLSFKTSNETVVESM